MIAQIPKYAKFLKDLCSNRKKGPGVDRINMSENVSAVFQKKLPNKCKDGGTFVIPCKIGNKLIEKALCDLGAGINVLSFKDYLKLDIRAMQNTDVLI